MLWMDDPQTNYAETATGTGTDSGSGVKTKENQKATDVEGSFQVD
jgi:hypothetical protein